MAILYYGIDESNHGRTPEIFVSVASFNVEDVKIRHLDDKLPKIRDHKNLITRLDDRDYSFTISTENKQSSNSLSKIYSSLVLKCLEPQIDRVELYIDGDLSVEKKRIIRRAVANTLEFDTYQVEVDSGPHYDRRVHLINLADQLANFLYRNKTLEELTSDQRFVKMSSS